MDLNKQAPYVSLQKRRGNNTFKGHYAFKEEYALLEVGYARALDDLPLIKVSCQLSPAQQRFQLPALISEF